MHPTKFGVSQGLTRKEDDALIRGQGRYVADVTPAGTLHAVVLRSPMPMRGFASSAPPPRAACRACISS